MRLLPLDRLGTAHPGVHIKHTTREAFENARSARRRSWYAHNRNSLLVEGDSHFSANGEAASDRGDRGPSATAAQPRRRSSFLGPAAAVAAAASRVPKRRAAAESAAAAAQHAWAFPFSLIFAFDAVAFLPRFPTSLLPRFPHEQTSGSLRAVGGAHLVNGASTSFVMRED
ncbi:hypothetical protein MTO96_023624 [Rhipicephalus appendiculatus]